MRDANFEKELKNRLGDHSSPIDLEAEWAALEAIRPPKRKRRFGFWIFWGGSSILILGLILWFTTLPNPALVVNDPAPTDQQLYDLIPDNKAEERSVSSNNHTPVAEEDFDAPLAKSTKVEPSELDDNSRALVKNQDLVKGDLTERIENTRVSDSVAKENTGVSSTPILALTNQVQEQSNTEQKGIVEIPGIDQYKAMTLLSLKLEPLQIKEPNMNWEFSEVPITKVLKTNDRWSLGIYSGYGKAFRQLSASEAELRPFIDRRNDAETTLDTWYTALNLRKRFGKHWFAEFGVGYAQTAIRFQDVNISTASVELDDQLISLTYRNDGTVEEAFGEVLAETTTTTSGVYYQYNRDLFFQLSGGRNIPFNQKTGINISMGLSFSLFSKKGGTVFSIDSPNIYADLVDSNYRKSGLINAMALTELYYRPNRNWEIALGLAGSAPLNNAYADQEIIEKRQFIALQAGLRKSF